MAQKDIDIAKAMGALRLYSDADQQDIMRGIGKRLVEGLKGLMKV